MHVEKDMCDKLIGALLNTKGKSNDGVNACFNLIEMKMQEDLVPRKVGKHKYLSPSCYTLSKKWEKISLCQF